MKFYWGLLVVLCATALADERRILMRDGLSWIISSQ
jgi:hypothetical protein